MDKPYSEMTQEEFEAPWKAAGVFDLLQAHRRRCTARAWGITEAEVAAMTQAELDARWAAEPGKRKGATR